MPSFSRLIMAEEELPAKKQEAENSDKHGKIAFSHFLSLGASRQITTLNLSLVSFPLCL